MPNPIQQVERELDKLRTVRAALAGDDLDEQTILECIESETDLLEVLGEIDASLLEDEMRLAALESTITKLQTRAARHEKTIEGKRLTMLKAMERAGVKSIPTPIGTISISHAPQSVVVFEQAAIPTKWLKPQEPNIDKSGLRKALLAGEKITGVTLSNAPSILSIRRS